MLPARLTHSGMWAESGLRVERHALTYIRSALCAGGGAGRPNAFRLRTF